MTLKRFLRLNPLTEEEILMVVIALHPSNAPVALVILAGIETEVMSSFPSNIFEANSITGFPSIEEGISTSR